MGANCSPRSSAAASRWTGLAGTTNADCASMFLSCIASASVVVFLPIIVQILLLSVMMATPTDPIGEYAWQTGTQITPVLTNRSWMGYEFDSTLGYPAEGPPTELPLAEFSEATEAWLGALEEQRRLIEQLPVVKSVDFVFGETANLTKVKVTVWCCWEASRSAFKQLHEACTEDDRKPSLLEAARVMRANLEKHTSASHKHDPRAIARREVLAHDPEAAMPAATDAFDRVRLAASRQQAVQRLAAADKAALEKAHSAEQAAVRAREQAHAKAKASQAAADTLKPPSVSHKKQRTAFAASAASCAEGCACGAAQCSECDADDVEPTYASWTEAKWKELENKEQKRRNTPIDPTNLEVSLPDGDETRGWRRHWRRGLFGALAAWAGGSQGAVVFMLAECILHFEVVSAVGKRLGLTLSKEAVVQAETDAYIIKRIKAALHVLKYCQSEAARIEYGIPLAALAPERLAERNAKGMIRKVTDRLGVQRGTRSYKSAYYNGRFTRELEPRPFDQGITRRAAFDEEAARTGRLAVGDAAIATSSCAPCTLVAIDYEKETCTLEFECGGVKRVQSFDSLRDKPGGARLHRPAPSLRPSPRAQRGDEKAEKARPKVEELFNTEGATSPSMRDQVRRRVGLGLYETAQALVIYAKRSALYALYLARYPAQMISVSTFKKLAPW